MPLLDRDGLRSDAFLRASGGEASLTRRLLVPWADLPEALARRGRDQSLGVEVTNALKASEIRPVQDQIDLIAIGFPTFGDGRGFSLAKQLRSSGFGGAIRAVGPLIADQFAYALACGFDEIELPVEIAARQPPDQWLAALGSITRTYQRGYGDAGNILEHRRKARIAAPGARP